MIKLQMGTLKLDGFLRFGIEDIFDKLHVSFVQFHNRNQITHLLETHDFLFPYFFYLAVMVNIQSNDKFSISQPIAEYVGLVMHTHICPHSMYNIQMLQLSVHFHLPMVSL